MQENLKKLLKNVKKFGIPNIIIIFAPYIIPIVKDE